MQTLHPVKLDISYDCSGLTVSLLACNYKGYPKFVDSNISFIDQNCESALIPFDMLQTSKINTSAEILTAERIGHSIPVR